MTQLASDNHQIRMNIVGKFIEAKHKELASSLHGYSMVLSKLIEEMSAELAVFRELERVMLETNVSFIGRGSQAASSERISALLQGLKELRQSFGDAPVDNRATGN